jgi:hypothetical protein
MAIWFFTKAPALFWSSHTYGQNCGSNQCVAAFQSDGNFVVYNGSTPLWFSNTGGNPTATLVLSSSLPYIQIISGNNSVLWASSYTFAAGDLRLTQGASVYAGSLRLVMQGDGNLVLYQGGTVLWSTGTYGQNCGTNQCVTAFQGDGNFVVYNGQTPLWFSNTGGNPGGSLVLSSQPPYLEVLAGNQSVLWAASDTISGHTLVGGSPLSGVTVALTGTTSTGKSASASTTTKPDGSYSFLVPIGGTYAVTPSLSGYTFSPGSKDFVDLSANQSGVDFSSSTSPSLPV